MNSHKKKDRKHNKSTERLHRLINSYQTARALMAADELELVELLHQGPQSVTYLAEKTATHPGTLERFLKLLVLAGLLKENDEGLYSLGPLADGLRDAMRGGLES
jgi:predicted transcriptional regulator